MFDIPFKCIAHKQRLSCHIDDELTYAQLIHLKSGEICNSENIRDTRLFSNTFTSAKEYKAEAVDYLRTVKTKINYTQGKYN